MTWEMHQMEMNTAAKVVEKEIKVEERQLLISQMQNEIDSFKLKKLSKMLGSLVQSKQQIQRWITIKILNNWKET